MSRRGCRFVSFFPPTPTPTPFFDDPPPAGAAARRTSQSLRVQSMKWWHPRRTSKSPWHFWKRAASRKWLSQGRQRPIALDGCDTPRHFLRLPQSQRRKGPRCQTAPFPRCSLPRHYPAFCGGVNRSSHPRQESGRIMYTCTARKKNLCLILLCMFKTNETACRLIFFFFFLRQPTLSQRRCDLSV